MHNEAQMNCGWTFLLSPLYRENRFKRHKWILPSGRDWHAANDWVSTGL